MRDKRQSSNSRPSFLQGFWNWFGELPPITRILVGGVVAGGIIWAILPPSLFHSFNCQVQNFPQNYRSSNDYFIDNQVIIVGSKDDVDAVIGTPTPGAPGTPPTTTTLLVVGTPTVLGTPATPATPVATATTTTAEPEKVILNPIEGCDLSYLDSRKVPDSNATREPRKLVMRLYEIPQGSTVEGVISEIGNKAGDREIFADPNYLTRLSDLTRDPCADPADGGGTGGGPFGDPGIPDTEVETRNATNGFMSQWAFGPQGINLFPSSSTFTGRKVRVGVFDTSPSQSPNAIFNKITIALPFPLRFSVRDYAGTTLVNSHGLFVSGLIHGIAPKSRIQLIRVLNDDGCGDLWALNKGLENYKSRMSAWTGDLDKTVINMSLGIRTASQAEKKDLDTLADLIKSANEEGAIIIAAAGNESYDLTKPIQEMQIPAAYDLVYGVAATNQSKNRSCYSNMGDLAAPGGDGGPWDVKQTNGTKVNKPCVSRAETWDQPGPNNNQAACTDMATCDYGLISLGYTRYGPRYMIWSGTSFAAPLVSGMAALAYERGNSMQVDCLIRQNLSPVLPTISKPLGLGIIDVSKSLSATMLSACGVRP